jgi:hypothetical protein
MKLLILAFCVIFAVASAQQSKYTTKYDGVNLDEILKSERLLNNYFKCLMETGKCTPDGNELKRTLPDALKTDCSKCKFFYLIIVRPQSHLIKIHYLQF